MMLRDFIISLLCSEPALMLLSGGLLGVKEIEHSRTKRRIIERLPQSMEDRWRREVYHISERKNRTVTYKDLVEFTEQESRIMTTLLLGRQRKMADHRRMIPE